MITARCSAGLAAEGDNFEVDACIDHTRVNRRAPQHRITCPGCQCPSLLLLHLPALLTRLRNAAVHKAVDLIDILYGRWHHAPAGLHGPHDSAASSSQTRHLVHLFVSTWTQSAHLGTRREIYMMRRSLFAADRYTWCRARRIPAVAKPATKRAAS